MKNVVILAYEESPLSALALPTDTLQSAGVFWNVIYSKEPEPFFKVIIITEDGQPVRCKGSVLITPDCSINDLDTDKLDLLFVSPVKDINSSFTEYSKSIQFIQDAYAAGCLIASVCTGAFLLAATGLLDGKKATTHWGLSRQFAQRFPNVELEAKKTVTEDSGILCSGGANAGADLCLHIIRKICGSQIAYRTARALVLDPSRVTQAPYEIFNFDKNHGDENVAVVQAWIESNYHDDVQVDSMAKKAGMSRRTFERRFKSATGESPGKYLQRVRVESARLMLETGMDTFEQITCRVGYEDTSSFRRIFQKATGLAPSRYREKFRVLA